MFSTSSGSCRLLVPVAGVDVDLFSTYIIAKNACPNKKAGIQILCPSCGQIFPGLLGQRDVDLSILRPGVFAGARACRGQKRRLHLAAASEFAILDAIGGMRPRFRLYGKLVLRKDGEKEYLPASPPTSMPTRVVLGSFKRRFSKETLAIPSSDSPGWLQHQAGYELRFSLLARLLQRPPTSRAFAASLIDWKLADRSTRDALLTLFSGVLEFNNMFASYKGEGTGAVRHMFSHHILKPERTPIEANVWGTPKSSGSFSNLFRSRLLRAIDYRESPDGSQRHGQRQRPGLFSIVRG